MFKMDVWTVSSYSYYACQGERLMIQESASNLYIWNDMNEVSTTEFGGKRHS